MANLKRLRDLVDVLKDVKKTEKNFNLEGWFGLADEETGEPLAYEAIEDIAAENDVYIEHDSNGLEIDSGDLQELAEPFLKAGCGTVACACGWAAVYPQFKGTEIAKGNIDVDGPQGKHTIPNFHWGDVWDTFELTSDQADHLFSSFRYPASEATVDHVIARVEGFIVEHETA